MKLNDSRMFFSKCLLGMLLLVTLGNSCQSLSEKKPSVQAAMIAQLDTNQHTTIQWRDTAIHFGKIKEGDTVRLRYVFTNTGNKMLFVNDVHPSCGCTIADFSKEPISPGGQGFINANFATRWHPGIQQKSITVKTNTRGKVYHKLLFSGEVIPQRNKNP